MFTALRAIGRPRGSSRTSLTRRWLTCEPPLAQRPRFVDVLRSRTPFWSCYRANRRGFRGGAVTATELILVSSGFALLTGVDWYSTWNDCRVEELTGKTRFIGIKRLASPHAGLFLNTVQNESAELDKILQDDKLKVADDEPTMLQARRVLAELLRAIGVGELDVQLTVLNRPGM